MQKILFVCLGNICRSPLAEGIMLHLRDRHQLSVEIDSAGTADYHVNEAPDHRTVANAKKNGIDLSQLRARQFVAADLDRFDRILVMDKKNLAQVLSFTETESQRKKVSLLLNCLPETELQEVPDPYYGTEKDFEAVFQLLHKACETLSKTFVKENLSPNLKL